MNPIHDHLPATCLMLCIRRIEIQSNFQVKLLPLFRKINMKKPSVYEEKSIWKTSVPVAPSCRRWRGSTFHLISWGLFSKMQSTRKPIRSRWNGSWYIIPATGLLLVWLCMYVFNLQMAWFYQLLLDERLTCLCLTFASTFMQYHSRAQGIRSALETNSRSV